MIKTHLKPEIRKLVGEKDWKNLKEQLSEWPTQDIAALIEHLHKKDAVILFRLLSKNRATEVFSQLEPPTQEALVKAFGNAELKKIITGLSPDDRTELFDDLPGALTQRMMNLLPHSDLKEAIELLGYPDHSVGRLMTPEYVAIRQNWTVKKAIDHIRRVGKDAETINMVYVTDTKWNLLGNIPIRKFLLSSSDHIAEALMNKKSIAIEVTEDQEVAYHLMKHYDLNVLPVVDSTSVLLGIVTIDDIIDVSEEEITEDFQKAAAVEPVEQNYVLASPLLLYKKRIGWLLLLLVANFFSSNVIAHFEYALQSMMALAFFIPVLIDSGGNTASQSSTLVIRAISTGELNLSSWFRVIKKELLVGLMLGITLGVVIFLRSYFWGGGFEIGSVIGISLILVMVWSNLLGSLLPIVLTKLKLDPAVVSSPLLTTVIDATGLLIYFSIAGLILQLN